AVLGSADCDSSLPFSFTVIQQLDMNAMNVDPLSQWRFAVKFKDHNSRATEEEVKNAYEAYKEFFYKYHKDHLTDCYMEYLQTLGSWALLVGAELGHRDIMWFIERSNINYITELNQQLGSIRDSLKYFNYLAVVQSSGYGKTRAIHELVKLYPVIYLCFRSSVSTGYLKVMTHSLTLKNEIEFCDMIAKAEAVANRWLVTIVITFLNKSRVYNRVDGKKYLQHILEDRESKASALTGKIFMVFVEQPDINPESSLIQIGDLVPAQDEDDSARDLNLHAHRPFVHIASTDCLRFRFDCPLQVSVRVFGNNICLSHSNTSYSEEEMKMGYNISMWNGMTYNALRERYRYLVDIAMTKLCGGTLKDLVKSHIVIIITAEDSGKKHLIGYPSESILYEGALTLLSRPSVELEVLKELDLVRKEGRVIDTGNREELYARILLLSARRQQILSFRKENYEIHIETLILIAYLHELFSSEFSHEKFQHLAAYDMGFTYFVALDHIPDESTLQLC
ncbi:1691_t:CDS:2, partial [Funneliformis mosseae]